MTDLEEVVLGLVDEAAADEIADGLKDSWVLFFLGIAPVLLLGAICLSVGILFKDSSGKFDVRGDDAVEPDEITAVVDILDFLLFSSTSLFANVEELKSAAAP